MFGATPSALGCCVRRATRMRFVVRSRCVSRFEFRPPPCSLVPAGARVRRLLYWREGRDRPEVKFPAGEQRSEPVEPTKNAVVLQSDLFAHARRKTWSASSHSPPASVAVRLHGSGASWGCVRGFVPTVQVGVAPGRGSRVVRSGRRVLMVGRAPFDCRYCGRCFGGLFDCRYCGRLTAGTVGRAPFDWWV